MPGPAPAAVVVAGNRTGKTAATPTLGPTASNIGTAPRAATINSTSGRTMYAFIGGAEAAVVALPSPWTLLADVDSAGSVSAARCSIWARSSPGGSVGTTTSTGDGTANVTLGVAEFENATATIIGGPVVDVDTGVASESLPIGTTAETATGLVLACAAANGLITSPALSGMASIFTTSRMIAGYKVASGAHSTDASWSTARRNSGLLVALATT